MKTEMALSINDTNRFMWMKLRVQCSFLRPRAGKTDALKKGAPQPSTLHPGVHFGTTDSTALSQGGCPPRPCLLPSSLNPHSLPGSHLLPHYWGHTAPSCDSLHPDQEDNARGVGLLPLVCLVMCGPGQVSCPLWGPISYRRSLSRDSQG